MKTEVLEKPIHNSISKNGKSHPFKEIALPEILFITSYPPRECGIATYSQDLLKALNNKFSNSFSLKVCALESGNTHLDYPEEVKYVLDTNDTNAYLDMAHIISLDRKVKFVLVQHEFGFFENNADDFKQFVEIITKPVVIVFHTVLHHPGDSLKTRVQEIAAATESIVVMTNYSANVLMNDYGIAQEKILVIPHGTHLVSHSNKQFLKEKYNLSGKNVLSTFGLLSSGKSIETTLEALPDIVKENPDVLFLIIGKTHPSVVKQEGEKYRNMLQSIVDDLQIQDHVRFINQFLPLPDLLEYLQLTDIYLFTSKDPNQAVSGTFSYAISCGCPVVSTPIPHVREVLGTDAGIIIDFENPEQLSQAVISLLNDEQLRKNMSSHGLHRMASTAWENSAIAHALLFTRTESNRNSLHYNLPAINLNHFKEMTTDFGMLQFSIINKPDFDSGYTLDDNARALIAMCMHYELNGDHEDINYISIYLDFISFCLQPAGNFLNYVDDDNKFTGQNDITNLADANGRAVWALGYLISKRSLLPSEIIEKAKDVLQRALPRVRTMHSTRAMAFAIKGLHYSNLEMQSTEVSSIIVALANRLVQMYRHESERDWLWFESYLTYANSLLPEALLCAWLETGDHVYKETAKASFDFLLSITFNSNGIKVISNKSWLHKGQEPANHGEQPIDVAYTILALNKFYNVFGETEYLLKMTTAFTWFLGNNHLHQIIYNPCTGGCYDGLEENQVNLNQGAESTLSYLMARLAIEQQYESPHKTVSMHEANLVVNV